MTDEPWGDVPPIPDTTGVRARIRSTRAASGRMIGVLDDDPTGSQAVHDIQVVTVPEPDEYALALSGPCSTAFVLTNTRSLTEPDAIALNARVAGDLLAYAARRDQPIDLISRSDSTLRGHVYAEIAALDAARRAHRGQRHDAILFAPAYLEVGRVTAGDVHWARVGDRFLPVGETEFARDATFGYADSDLRDFMVTASRGAIPRDQTTSISLDDIRIGGPERVAEVIEAAIESGRGRRSHHGAVVVVNALDYADLEIVALAALTVETAGRSLLYRCGPSLVRALDGQEPRGPLTEAEIWPHGHPGGHGLIVVGSHVGQTTRQVARLREQAGAAEIEIDVPALLTMDDAAVARHIAAVAADVGDALQHSDVLLITSRALVATADGEESLGIARRVSAAVSGVVTASLAAAPAWVVAKGGITSHDVAVRGLGIRRAEVAGQLFPGAVSLYRPLAADARAIGRPYIVFAGNVGDENALADVARRMSGKDAR